MTTSFPHVAVTRDESPSGPLSTALRSCGLEPVACQAVREMPPRDPRQLRDAARHLERYDWLVVASRRAVFALMKAGDGSPLPARLRTAAVGTSTAAALMEFGAAQPLTADRPGAEALAQTLRSADEWSGKRVLLPRAEEGGRVLAETLKGAGAVVQEVDAYRTMAVAPERLAGAWMRNSPKAAIIASPSAARSLVDAITVAMLNRVEVIAIGPTTVAALKEFGVVAHVAARVDFTAAAELAAERLGLGPAPAKVSSARQTPNEEA